MKKTLSIIVVIALLFSLFGCYKGQESINGEVAYLYDFDNSSKGNTDYLITETARNYAIENDLTFAEYRMTDNSSKSFANTVDLASMAGARIIFVPNNYQKELLECHYEYPDIRFILLDANLSEEEIGEVANITSVRFDWYEIGYFTGYLFTYKKYSDVIFLNQENSSQTDSYLRGLVHGMSDSALENKINTKITVENIYSLSVTQFEERIREIASSDFDLLVYHGDAVMNSLNNLMNKTAQHYISINNQEIPNIYSMVNVKRNFEVLVREVLEKFYHGGFSDLAYVFGLKQDTFALQYNLGTMPETADFYYIGIVDKIKNGDETIVEDFTELKKLKLKNLTIVISQ